MCKPAQVFFPKIVFIAGLYTTLTAWVKLLESTQSGHGLKIHMRSDE